MILTFKDRIKALRRSKKYRQDFETYQKYCLDNDITDGLLLDWLCPTPLSSLSKAAQDLCKKYELPFPVNPEGVITDLANEILLPIESNMEQLAVRPIPLEEGKTVFGLEDKRYLNVSIDMTRTENEITQDIKRLYDHYSPQIKRNHRQGSTIQDPWYIYDQVEREGKNFSMIAKELSGIDENPTYNETVDAVRQQVREAYRKAKSMISVVED